MGALRRCVSLALLVATAAFSTGCGGHSRTAHPEASQRVRIEAAIDRLSLTYGNLSAPQWEQVALRRVHITSMSRLPAKGTQRVLDATGTATLVVSPAHAVGALAPGQQVVLATHAVTVERAVRVKAVIARRNQRAWAVARLLDVRLATQRTDLAHDSAIAKVARASLRTVLTFNGSQDAYARAQPHSYATTAAAGDNAPPVAFTPHTALLGPSCPWKFTLDAAALLGGFSPSRVRPIGIRITKIQALFGLPPTVRVFGRATVATSHWGQLSSLAARAPAACKPTTSRIAFSLVMVRSVLSGRWLAAQLDAAANGGFQYNWYQGLDAW